MILLKLIDYPTNKASNLHNSHQKPQDFPPKHKILLKNYQQSIQTYQNILKKVRYSSSTRISLTKELKVQKYNERILSKIL